MALINFFGFDDNNLEPWMLIQPNVGVVAGRRTGSNAWSFSTTCGVCRTQVAGGATKLFIGIATKNNADNSLNLLINAATTGFISTPNNSGTYIRVQSGQPVTTYVGNNATGVGTKVVPSLPGWSYVQILVDNTTGAGKVQVLINGEEYLLWTLGASLNANWQTFLTNGFFLTPATGTCLVDDLYICDNSGSSMNNFLGDCQIDRVMPNAVGKSTQWINSAGNQVNNYTYVDEFPASITDYVQSSTVGDTDFYAVEDLPAGRQPLAVKAHAYAQKNDSGDRSIQVGIAQDQGGGSFTEAWSGTTFMDLTPKLVSYGPASLAPDGTAWTAAKINAMQVGVKVV